MPRFMDHEILIFITYGINQWITNVCLAGCIICCNNSLLRPLKNAGYVSTYVCLSTRLSKTIGVMSSVNFGGGARHFCPNIYAWKINKMPKFYMTFARKINKIPEFYIYAWKN